MSLLRSLLAAALLAHALACPAQQPAPGQALATFAGGCFWCMEPPYDALPGVISTTSGYMGGTKKNPSYEEVSSGTTGHAEVVQVAYDPKKVNYEKLLEVFWKNVDPTVRDREFWPAEDYHQDFYVKNPVRYRFYRDGCGRDARLKQLWGSVPH